MKIRNRSLGNEEQEQMRNDSQGDEEQEPWK
jgi:hypothetical protein